MSSVSRSLTALTWILYPLALLIMLAPLLLFWAPSNDYVTIDNDIIEAYGGLDALVQWQRIAGFFVTSLPSVALLWSIFLLLKLVKALKEGEWFSETSEKLCRRFGYAMLWYVAMEFIHRTLLVMVITATYPEGERHFSISLSSDDLIALVPAIFALIFAHMVSLGREQQNELKQII